MMELNNRLNNSLTPKYAQAALDRFHTGLVGVEMGIAWGGGVERIGHLWRGLGVIHGFDTFEARHPKALSYSPTSFEATCMDEHYVHYDTSKLSYEYQRQELDRQGLSNVILHKGLINHQSLADIPLLHYAFLDMDLLISMALGYQLVREKVVPRGFLCLHDVLPRGHIFGLWGLYQEILAEGIWRVVEERTEIHVTILERV